MMTYQQKTVSNYEDPGQLDDRCLVVLSSGGPGPEIAIAVERFPAGRLVRLTVRVMTAGGQSAEFSTPVIIRG